MPESESDDVVDLRIRRVVSLRNPLPLRDHDADVYRVDAPNADALIVLDPAKSELRIPSIRSEERGGMADLLDALVAELGTNRLRFVNVTDGSKLPEIFREVADELGEDADVDVDDDRFRDIRDVVHGFDEVAETWDDDRVECLVGEWRPDEYE